MASSLLFRIKSVFESQGFEQAKGGFTSVLGTFAKLTAATAVLVTNFGNLKGAFSVLTARGSSFLGTAAKLIFSFRSLGVAAAFFAVDITKGLVKGLVATIPAAARAEVSYVRLKNQLDLLGKGSEANIKRVQQFAETVAATSQFSSNAAQEAVTIALRRTGNIERAIKQVALAQDIAAATGRDLTTVTQLLNVAQAGNTRFIRQITNLRQADIETAVKQGNLIDLLSSKFSGSASRSTSTLAAKTQILSNLQEQLAEDFGKVGLPIAKFIKDIQILITNIALFGERSVSSFRGFLNIGADVSKFFQENSTFSGRFVANLLNGQNAAVAFGGALRQSVNDTKRFNNEIAKGSNATFDFDKQLEIQTLRLGKTVDERRELTRQLIRVEDILAIAQQDGTEALTKDQKDLVSAFQFSSRRLNQILSNETTDLKTQFEKQQELATQRRAETARNKGGAFFSPQEAAQFVINSNKAGASVSQISKGLQNLTGVSQTSATAVTTAIIAIGSASDTVKTKLLTLSETLKSLSSEGNLQTALADVTDQIEKNVKATVQPKFNVNIDFQFPVEALQSAVFGAVSQLIPSIIARITNTAKTASREARANSSAT